MIATAGKEPGNGQSGSGYAQPVQAGIISDNRGIGSGRFLLGGHPHSAQDAGKSHA
jgi:hypothetical protein